MRIWKTEMIKDLKWICTGNMIDGISPAKCFVIQAEQWIIRPQSAQRRKTRISPNRGKKRRCTLLVVEIQDSKPLYTPLILNNSFATL